MMGSSATLSWSSELILGQVVVLMGTSNPEEMSFQLLLNVEIQKFRILLTGASRNPM